MRAVKKPTTVFPLNALGTAAPAEPEDPVKKSINELKKLLTSRLDYREPIKNTAFEPNTCEAEVEAVGPVRQYPPQRPPMQYPTRQYHRQPEPSDQFSRDQRYPLPPSQPRYQSQSAPYDRAYADLQYNRPPAHQQQYPPQRGYQPQRSAVICFACGVKGHRRPECTNPPLPMEEQRELYESIMFDKGYARLPRNDRYDPNRQYTDPPYVDQSERQPERYQPPQQPPPLKQSLQAPPPPPPHRQATSDMPGIALRIEPVDAVEGLGLPRHSSGYRHITFDESAMLEVMANIKDDAVYAAEKRKRGTASASGTDAGRARKQQVVSNASEPLIMPDTPMLPPPNPSAAPFVPAPNPVPAAVPLPSRPFLRSQNRRRTEDTPTSGTTKPTAQNPEDLPAKATAKAKRTRRPFQPIRLMKGHSQFDFIKSFRNAPVAGITWGDLINLAPVIKRDVAKALTREQLVPRKKKVRIADEVEDIDTIEIRRARPEGTSPVVNFYTYGMVRNIGNSSKDGMHSLGKILIDGGSVMNILLLGQTIGA